MQEEKLTAAERKRLATLDKKIEKLQVKISAKRKEYDELTGQLQVLLDERYPKNRDDRMKEKLYKAYLDSERSFDEILELIENADEYI